MGTLRLHRPYLPPLIPIVPGHQAPSAAPLTTSKNFEHNVVDILG